MAALRARVPTMIKRIHIQNYKALRDVTLNLTPIHVLIGPNDSGKTSILEAIAALGRSVDHPLSDAFAGAWEGRQLVSQGSGGSTVTLIALVVFSDKKFQYKLVCEFAPAGRSVQLTTETIQINNETPIGSNGDSLSMVYRVSARGQTSPHGMGDEIELVRDALGGVQSYRWDARFLALPVAPDMKRRFRMEPSGFGLALCLDDILGFDRQRFMQLEERFTTIFPAIKSIKLIPESAYRAPVDDPQQVPMLNKSDGKGLYFEFAGVDEPIPARQVSDGVLLVLAYLAVLYLPDPPRFLLVEEPENGIHPRRLQDVLKILRDLATSQSQTQVILTTHSPYAVDLFAPEEVTLCQKQADGTVAVQRLSDSQTVREQLKVFTLGEIWTAEGDAALAQPATD
jgi:predicted ATPase